MLVSILFYFLVGNQSMIPIICSSRSGFLLCVASAGMVCESRLWFSSVPPCKWAQVLRCSGRGMRQPLTLLLVDGRMQGIRKREGWVGGRAERRWSTMIGNYPEGIVGWLIHIPTLAPTKPSLPVGWVCSFPSSCFIYNEVQHAKRSKQKQLLQI